MLSNRGLLQSQPLQELVIANTVLVLFYKSSNLSTVRRLESLWPLCPSPALRIGLAEVLIQGIKSRHTTQAFTTFLTVGDKCLATFALVYPITGQMLLAEIVIDQLQHCVLHGSYQTVVDIVSCMRFSQTTLKVFAMEQLLRLLTFSELGHHLWINIQHITIGTAGGAVRRGMFRIGWIERMQRVKTHKIGTLTGKPSNQNAQITEIAHPPVLPGT